MCLIYSLLNPRNLSSTVLGTKWAFNKLLNEYNSLFGFVILTILTTTKGFGVCLDKVFSVVLEDFKLSA